MTKEKSGQPHTRLSQHYIATQISLYLFRTGVLHLSWCHCGKLYVSLGIVFPEHISMLDKSGMSSTEYMQ